MQLELPARILSDYRRVGRCPKKATIPRTIDDIMNLGTEA